MVGVPLKSGQQLARFRVPQADLAIGAGCGVLPIGAESDAVDGLGCGIGAPRGWICAFAVDAMRKKTAVTICFLMKRPPQELEVSF